MRERVEPGVTIFHLREKPCQGVNAAKENMRNPARYPNLMYTMFNIFYELFSCIFCHLWPKLPQRLPMVPMMVEPEPMGGTAAISSPFLSHKILAKNGACNLPQNLSSCMNYSSLIASTPLIRSRIPCLSF